MTILTFLIPSNSIKNDHACLLYGIMNKGSSGFYKGLRLPIGGSTGLRSYSAVNYLFGLSSAVLYMPIRSPSKIKLRALVFEQVHTAEWRKQVLRPSF